MTKHSYRRKEFPCVLCEEGTYDWDHVCNQCRTDRSYGFELRMYEEDEKNAEKAEFIPIVWYWWLGRSNKENERLDRSDITKRLRESAIRLGNGKDLGRRYHPASHKQIGKPYIPGHEGSVNVYRFPRRGTWKTLIDLTTAVADLCRYYYEDGYRDGSRLLNRIIDGDISIKEINERAVGERIR